MIDKLRTARKQMEILHKTFDSYKIDPEQNLQNANREHNGRRSSVSYELNLRLMLSAYHLGTGACDLSKLFSMLGFGNMLNFERSFYRHEHDINERIIKVTRRTIASALLEEIRMTAEAALSEVIDDRSLRMCVFLQTV